MIYLDYNATTPIAKEVGDAMQPYIYGNFGNPSSNHQLGRTAKKAVEEARGKVADLINSSPEEVIFTSGGSESNNMVIKGVAETLKHKGNHIITSLIEHPAVLMPCEYLKKHGYEISYVPVDKGGVVDIEILESMIKESTILVTIMHSNNETGTLQPIKEIGEICKKYDVLFHTDASQSLGKVPVDVKELGVDFLTIAGHKMYAPKGIGALYMKKGIEINQLVHGANHESGRRAGTENIIFDVALGTAAELAKKNLQNSNIKNLTDYFYNSLKEKLGDKIHLNGHKDKKLPNTLNISFIGYNGHEILEKLEGVAASTGSACHSGCTSISAVFKAMGASEEIGRGAVRFSLGKYTTKEEIELVIEKLCNIVN